MNISQPHKQFSSQPTIISKPNFKEKDWTDDIKNIVMGEIDKIKSKLEELDRITTRFDKIEESISKCLKPIGGTTGKTWTKAEWIQEQIDKGYFEMPYNGWFFFFPNRSQCRIYLNLPEEDDDVKNDPKYDGDGYKRSSRYRVYAYGEMAGNGNDRTCGSFPARKGDKIFITSTSDAVIKSLGWGKDPYVITRKEVD